MKCRACGCLEMADSNQGLPRTLAVFRSSTERHHARMRSASAHRRTGAPRGLAYVELCFLRVVSSLGRHTPVFGRTPICSRLRACTRCANRRLVRVWAVWCWWDKVAQTNAGMRVVEPFGLWPGALAFVRLGTPPRWCGARRARAMGLGTNG